MIYCHCVAVFLVLGCNIFHWQIIYAVLLSEGKPCVSHINNTFLNWASGNSVLGAVLWEWCLLSIQATILMLVLLLIHCPHTQTHIGIHTAHTSSFIIPVTNLYKPISDLCVDWFQMGVAGKGKGPHQYLPRVSLRGALVRFRTRNTVQAPKHFQPPGNESILLSVLHGCFKIYVSGLEILQNTPTLAMTSSWISYYSFLFLLTKAMAI